MVKAPIEVQEDIRSTNPSKEHRPAKCEGLTGCLKGNFA
jgi:hypothetical protein